MPFVWTCIFMVVWRGAVGFVMVITDKRTAENEEQIQKVNQFHKEYDLFTYKNANKIHRDLKRKKKG